MSDAFAPSFVDHGNVRYGNDDQLDVRFYWKDVEDEKRTKALGRAVSKSVEYCRKQAPGDTRTVWDAPVTDTDKQRWPQLYDAFRRNEEAPPEGTALESWPMLNREMRDELNRWGFRTVEQIVKAADSNIEPRIKPLIAKVRRHAELFLESFKEGESERRLLEELEGRDSKIANQETRINTLTAELNKMREQMLQAPLSDMKPIGTIRQEEPVHNPLEDIPDLPTEIPSLEEVQNVSRLSTSHSETVEKRRPGRPKGSKNKPKVVA